MNSNKDFVLASVKLLRVSPRKLSLVANLVKNLKVSEAMVQLSFSSKRIAKNVKQCLQSAVANAENNFSLDVNKLYVKSITVGKSLVIKRMTPRARGRASGIKRFFSNLYITVAEREEDKGV